MPKISIIVPVFNAEKYLRKCISSILNQTFENIEVILINDGSKDNSEKICLEFAELDKRVKYLYQENSGVSSARNKGIAIAGGDYLGFVDSDDWIDDDMYEALFDLITQTQSDIAINSFYFDIDGKVQRVEDNLEIKEFNSSECIKELLQGSLFNGELCNKLFKRTLFDDVRLDESIHTSEDLVAVCEAVCLSNKIVYQSVHKYHYVQNSESACHIKFNEKKWSLQLACRKIKCILEKYDSGNVCYAQQYLIVGNLSLATALCKIKGLNRQHYLRIKQEIKTNLSKAAIRLLQKKTKISLKFFLSGRLFYIIYRFLIDNLRTK